MPNAQSLVRTPAKRRPQSAGRGAKSDPFTQSKAEAARLKVAALANDDDQPSLITDGPAPRKRGGAPDKPAKPTGKTGAKGEKAAPSKAAPSKAAAPQPAAPKVPEPAPPGKKEKPKMRLVNGKMIPVDDGPRLF